jgi:hypothetical protein
MQQGRVVERGTHAELVALGRAYATLAAQQDSTASGRRPGADGGPARARRVEPHGHRGCLASI